MNSTNNLNYILKAHHENHLAHAFLIETNDVEKTNLELLEIIKEIFLDQKGINHEQINHLIDIHSLPNLIEIEPDGMNIKKEQIVSLLKKFSKSPIFVDKNIYIIKYADKLNQHSANALLKFIEEPLSNTIGFFLTREKDNVINTIQSRCQLLNNFYEEDMKVELDESFIDNYLEKYHGNIEALFLYHKNEETFKTKSLVIELFKGIYKKYNFHLLKKEENVLLKSVKFEDLVKQIKLVEEILDRLQYNVNIQALLDYYVIEKRC